MKVSLRKKPLSGNRNSLYLDYYPPIPCSRTGKTTRREFLKLFTYRDPKGSLQREHNKETLIVANTLQARRQLEVQAKRYEMFESVNQQRDFIKYFKNLADKRNTSKGNHDNWLSAYKYFTAFAQGSCRMEDVTEKLCNNFREFLLHGPCLSKRYSERKLSQNSMHSYFNKFRAAVNLALQEGLLKSNPLKNVKTIKPGDAQREFLTLTELNRLVQTDCDIPSLKSMAIFSALSGIRWSDISRMTWGQVHPLEPHGYYVKLTQTKTKRMVVIPISDQAYQLLGTPGNITDRVFPNVEYSAWMNTKLKHWALRAGIRKNITFHSFRHTYATLQLSMGTSLYTIKELLGHKDIQTTQIYARVLSESKIEAANKIRIDLPRTSTRPLINAVDSGDI